jgi:hypothetical protein
MCKADGSGLDTFSWKGLRCTQGQAAFSTVGNVPDGGNLLPLLNWPRNGAR